MARYKKNTKMCKFCGRRKHIRKFGTNPHDYCLSCWRLYIKYFPSNHHSNERINLMKMADIFRTNPKYRQILRQIIADNSSTFLSLRKHLQHYGKIPNQQDAIIQLLEMWSSMV